MAQQLLSWEQIDARPVPKWFQDAHLGIFIHWGPYSVPAWAPRRSQVERLGLCFAEWYGWLMRDPEMPQHEFHKRNYNDRPYSDFAQSFTAELFDPAEWADLFARTGAEYVVLTAKHHDGYCLWPSPHAPGWNSADVGPRRDLVGELAAAVRKRGMTFGLYYSLMEWDHPLYNENDLTRYVDEHMLPQIQQLVQAYNPDVLWTDGEWQFTSEQWQSRKVLSWLINESPVKDRIAFNDRWGSDTRSRHGGFHTTEYGHVDDKGTAFEVRRKWEECRSLGYSFGHNRNETLDDYLTRDQWRELRDSTNARGGNLLLNVGPRADGTIDLLVQERLADPS